MAAMVNMAFAIAINLAHAFSLLVQHGLQSFYNYINDIGKGVQLCDALFGRKQMEHLLDVVIETILSMIFDGLFVITCIS